MSTFHQDSNLTPTAQQLSADKLYLNHFEEGFSFIDLTGVSPPLFLLPGSNIPKYMPEVLKYRHFLCNSPAFLRFKHTTDLFKGLTLTPVLIFFFIIASLYEVN